MRISTTPLRALARTLRDVAVITAIATITWTAGCGAGTPGAERPPVGPPSLTPQTSGTTALLQAVSPVDERVVWASGHEGMYARTTDGGRSWHASRGPGPDSLQFRDVHAVDARTAYLLSAGPGALSRIYKTTDAGDTWTLQFRAREPEAFFDCFDFWDASRGVAFGDAVDGEFMIMVTRNGGESWSRVPPERVPDALPGAGSFAASGTCVIAGPGGRAWIGTGAASTARVLRTTDYGRNWSVAPTPIVAGELAGIFSLAFRDSLHGLAFGGDLDRPDVRTDSTVAVTDDGGRTWVLGGRTSLAGPVYGAAYVPGAPTPTLIAVGPNGMDYSTDAGRSWVAVDSAAYWSVGFAPGGVGWAVGPGGRMVKIDW